MIATCVAILSRRQTTYHAVTVSNLAKVEDERIVTEEWKSYVSASATHQDAKANYVWQAVGRHGCARKKLLAKHKLALLVQKLVQKLVYRRAT